MSRFMLLRGRPRLGGSRERVSVVLTDQGEPNIGDVVAQIPLRYAKFASQKNSHITGGTFSSRSRQRVSENKIGLRACAHACLTISTEISTAGIAPLFSSQCVVFLSSGQPNPGP